MTHLRMWHEGFSGSKSPLLEHCLAFASPDATWDRDEAGPEAHFGSATHRVIERGVEAKLKGGKASDASVVEACEEFDLDDDQTDRLLRIAPSLFDWVEKNANETWQVEVPFLLDPIAGSARQLEKTSHRAYDGKGETEIGVTLDILARDANAPWRAIVADVKTGWGMGLRSPAENRQLLTQALAVCLHLEVSEVLLLLVLVDESGVRLEEVLVSDIELEQHREWLEDRLTRSLGAPATPGTHCTEMFCPAKTSCPALLGSLDGALVESGSELARQEFRFGPPTSPEHARWLVHASAMVELGLRRIDKSLREWADANGGIPLGEGKVWRKVVNATEAIDLEVEGAVEVMQKHGALGSIETKQSATWKDVEALIGAKGAKVLRAELGARGCLKQGQRVTYKATG